MDLQKKIDEASSRLMAAQKERKEAEASALAHEDAARKDRLRMSDLKKEAEELNAVLRHAGVQQATENAAASAKAAQADAERARTETAAALDSIKAKEAAMSAKMAELDKLLAEAREAAKE